MKLYAYIYFKFSFKIISTQRNTFIGLPNSQNYLNNTLLLVSDEFN